MKIREVSVLALAVFLWGMPVRAQSVQSLGKDVERLREEVEIIQRKLYRAEVSDSTPSATSSGTQVRLSQMEEQMRDLTGKLDEIEYRIKKINERFDVLNRDIDVRFKMIEGKPVGNNGLGTKASAAKRFDAPVAKGAPKSVSGASVKGEELAPLPTPKKKSVKEIYQQGLDDFNASKYDAAEKQFDLVLKDYPKDMLAGNAQYWLGEVYYARAEYERAAVAFGKSYKNYKDGNKGADSIYKLGLTMQKLGKNAEACAAYLNLPNEFPKAEKALKDKAAAAAKKLNCK